MPAVMSYTHFDLEALNALLAVGGPLADVLVHLNANNFTPAKSMVLADFVEATFDGYAAVNVLAAGWTAPYVNGAGNGELSTLAQVAFDSTGITTSEMIYGYYVTDNPATVVLFAEKVAVAVPMGAVAGEHLGVIPRVTLAAMGFDGTAALLG